MGEGWVVLSGDGKRYRTWKVGWSDWTDDREQAVRYARREDAEAVHSEDEDAWLIQPYSLAHSAPKDAEVEDHSEDARVMVVPDGYVLVPIECTDEIAEAIAFEAHVCGGVAESTWRKALAAAASSAPVAGKGEGSLTNLSNRPRAYSAGPVALIRP